MLNSRAARMRVWLILLALCALTRVHQTHYDLQNDDAYITYRYATSWADGLGVVFNPGERVEGYTNFLLLVVLAGAARIGCDVVVLSRLLGSLAGVVIVCLGYRLVVAEFGRSRRVGLATAAALAGNGALAANALSGLETLLLAAILLAAQLAFLREQRQTRPAWGSGVLFGLAALLRADGLLFTIPPVLWLLLRQGRSRRSIMSAASVAGIAVFVTLAHAFWRQHYYGQWLPNTYHLRVGGDLFQQVRGLFYLHKYFEPFGGVLLAALPLALLALRDGDRNAARLLLGLSVGAHLVYVVWVGGDYMPMSRFLVPIIAPLTVLLIESVLEIVRQLRSARLVPLRWVQWFEAIALCVVIVTGCIPTINPRRPPQNALITTRTLCQQWTMAGLWFRVNAPPGAALAAEAVGALGYYSRLPIVDMHGVTDSHIAGLRMPHMGHGIAGHEKQDLAYVLSRAPDFIFEGVMPTRSADKVPVVYPHGVSYLRRCVSLGPGPVAGSFGDVEQRELFAVFQEKCAIQPQR